jgi:hypothetical protein
VDIIHKCQWVLLRADLVLHDPNLRLSPLGVVPQYERIPMAICDYSFFLINLETIPLAPTKSMQFGCALWFTLSTVHHANPHLDTVFLSRVDITYGLYCIWVHTSDAPKLGVVVPTEPRHQQVIGLPMVLPMGWMQPHLEDVGIYIRYRKLDLFQCTDVELDAATSVSYTCTTQKNGTRGEKLVQGRRGNSLCCPVRATVHHIKHYRLKK